MKTLAFLLGIGAAGVAAAECYTQTFVVHGTLTVCTTCIDLAGNSTTTCI